MIKYRIKEEKFDDGRIEFIPQKYDKEYCERMLPKDHDGWLDISEQWMKITKKGYDTYDDALNRLNDYKDGLKKDKGQNIVKEKIHKVD